MLWVSTFHPTRFHWLCGSPQVHQQIWGVFSSDPRKSLALCSMWLAKSLCNGQRGCKYDDCKPLAKNILNSHTKVQNISSDHTRRNLLMIAIKHPKNLFLRNLARHKIRRTQQRFIFTRKLLFLSTFVQQLTNLLLNNNCLLETRNCKNTPR